MSTSSSASLLRHLHCHFSTSPSSILNPSNATSILASKKKSVSALKSLKSLQSFSNSNPNPNSILSICRAAALSPSSSSIDRSALSLAVSLLSSSPSSVRSLLSDLPDGDPSRIILLFGHAGLISDSLTIFKSNPSTNTLNSLLLASFVSRDYASVEKFYKELPKAYNLTRDTTTYNTLVKSFAESGSTMSVYSMLDEMHQRKVMPNATTFTNAISGFYREERLDEVGKILVMMKKKRYGLNPGSLAVYNARIEGLCKLKRAKEAKELLVEMKWKRMKGNWVTYDRLIVGFCSEGDLEEAKRLYGEMRSRNGAQARGGCYFRLVYHLCEGGDFEGALGVCRDAMERNWVPCFKTMKVLVNGLAKAGKFKEAKGIVGNMKERFPNQAETWMEVEESLLHSTMLLGAG